LGVKGIVEGCHSLTSLDLTWCTGVTDLGVKGIGEGCKQLKKIWLFRTKVSEEGIKKLKEAIAGLSIED
jgi:hypothetical protein